MSTVINQHCATIREQEAAVTNEQLKNLFDVSITELDKNNTSLDIISIKQILNILNNLPHRCQQLVEPELIGHQLIIFLRDCVLVDQFRQKQIRDVDLLIDLSTLFANICRHINDTNTYLFKELLFHKPLIDELTNCLNEITTSGKHLNDSQFLSSIRLLLIAFQRFEKQQTEIDKSSQSTSLLFPVIKCLCSSYAIDALKALENNFSQNLTEKQILLLSTCPLYFYWFSGDHTPELFSQVPRALLNPFTRWVTNCPLDSIIHCSSELRDIMRHLSFACVRPINWETANVSSQEFYDDYCQLISQWLSFLQIIIQHSSDELNLKSISRFFVQDLYNFTLNPNVLSFMKTMPNLISILLKMSDVQQDETQLNAFRCLGKIMTEDDIKAMNNPSKISMIYVKFVSNSIDDPRKKERFYSLLESLKNWVQHDQVKVHLIEQKILPLLIRSATETKFDPLKVQKPALEILLALSFINDASSYLKENEKFISYIRNLSTNTDTNKSSLQRAAEGLLWKLEKETEAVSKPSTSISNSYQYDIMISYSHSDKQLCHQIYEQLVKDGFRVWIDRDHMHGATMIAMANAIENSHIVIICMSDAYKQSVYCQSEAHYAFERQRRLIPLIMKRHYKPDGWLGIIISGKIYVDFIKRDFNLAYESLKAEISQHCQQDPSPITLNTKEEDSQNETVTRPVEKTSTVIEQNLVGELPHCVNQWTNDHVKSFLISIGLKNTLLRLCMRMDGHRLLQLYEMCMINRESMFQSLKAELIEENGTMLPINDYVTFLYEIKKYVPITTMKSRPIQSDPISSVVCSIM